MLASSRFNSVRRKSGSAARGPSASINARSMEVIKAERTPCPITSQIKIPAHESEIRLMKKKSPPTMLAGRYRCEKPSSLPPPKNRG
jgi:hypothetical protein